MLILFIGCGHYLLAMLIAAIIEFLSQHGHPAATAVSTLPLIVIIYY
jgi:hypothetical protein